MSLNRRNALFVNWCKSGLSVQICLLKQEELSNSVSAGGVILAFARDHVGVEPASCG